MKLFLHSTNTTGVGVSKTLNNLQTRLSKDEATNGCSYIYREEKLLVNKELQSKSLL